VTARSIMKGEKQDSIDLSGVVPLTMLVELGLDNVTRDLSFIFQGKR